MGRIQLEYSDLDRISRGSVGRAALALLLSTVVAAAVPAPAYAGPWTVGFGRLWTKIAFFFHRTDELFWREGERIPIFNEGRSTNMAVFAEAIFGLHDRVDLWLQVPYMVLLFDDAAGNRDSNGIGDIRVMLRVNLLRFAQEQALVSLRFGAKAPVGDFDNDPEIIPIGEGQWDFDVTLESGYSFWPLPGYAALDLGYRFRTENQDAQREPGDEFFFLFDSGYQVAGPWGVKLVVDGLFGRPLSEAGFEIASSNREYVFLQPEIVYVAGPWFIEAGVRIPVHGRNFPAGQQWLIGASRVW